MKSLRQEVLSLFFQEKTPGKLAMKITCSLQTEIFVYLTGLKTSRQAVLLATKEADGSVHEQVYILPSDAYAERWLVRELSRRKQKKFQGLVIYVLWMHLNVISRHWLSAAVTRNCILRCRCSV